MKANGEFGVKAAEVGKVLEQIFVLREAWQQSFRNAIVENEALGQICDTPASQLHAGTPQEQDVQALRCNPQIF